MRPTYLTFLLLILTCFSYAQTDGITYQAVIIDNNPQEIPGVDIPSNNIPNTALQVRFTIIDNLNNSEYQETHNTTTNAYSMINLVIGKGTPNIGAFDEIYWNNSKFLMVEIDLNDGNGMIEFSYQELTYIPYVRHREIIATSTLDVDGVTNLNSDLFVNNGSSTTLSGNLTVQGTSLFQDDITVEGTSLFQDNITVEGTSLFQDDITVEGTSNLNDQVTINANITGGEESYEAYPLRIEGSQQGIAVRLTAGTPNNSNNFITFFDNGGNAVGRIEGETTAEAASDPEFIYEESILIAEEVKAGVNVASSFTPIVVGGVGAATGPCGPCIASAAADLALATANLVTFNLFALSNLGVTYQSGSADYAEWLERSNFGEKMSAGDIVGVNGGKISKYTMNSQHYMVVSTKPAILGNMPMQGNEALYEKVAFMGQIPVKVRGIVLQGDYIIPSGLNDGTGIGVSPQKIKAEQYREIVGVAWSEALINNGVSMINMAIGLNANDVANLAIEQEKKIKVLEDKFKTLEQRLLALEHGSVEVVNLEKTTTEKENKTPQKELSRSQLVASYMPPELSDEIMEEAMLYLENGYKNNGIDIENHPGLNKLFNDSNYRKKIIAKTKANYKKSYKKLLEKN
ncbi:hypothetical protein [Flavivirga jejuensis]|uniref:Peptidase S74 domain-containing protein n=1 Tax=Flavivirga jejuensis TaxID=870487 RepID=A0ABT8WS00_9FLAO|nr:hypothetical protein [Flavivirga jejuensis]MDO5975884.1 hypothetical protein [Flavivirga jejuensis]